MHGPHPGRRDRAEPPRDGRARRTHDGAPLPDGTSARRPDSPRRSGGPRHERRARARGRRPGAPFRTRRDRGVGGLCDPGAEWAVTGPVGFRRSLGAAFRRTVNAAVRRSLGAALRRTVNAAVRRSLGAASDAPSTPPTASPSPVAVPTATPTPVLTPPPRARTVDAPVPARILAVLGGVSADRPLPYRDGCHVSMGGRMTSRSCLYGNLASRTTIALFGDSHALAWFPAVLRFAGIAAGASSTSPMSACVPADIVPLQPQHALGHDHVPDLAQGGHREAREAQAGHHHRDGHASGSRRSTPTERC